MPQRVQGFLHPSPAICADLDPINLSQASQWNHYRAQTHCTTQVNKTGHTMALSYYNIGLKEQAPTVNIDKKTIQNPPKKAI